MRDSRIKRVQIEEGAEDYNFAHMVLRAIGGVPVEKVEADEAWGTSDPIDMDKETLRLIAFEGEFLKPCPGTKGYICCGYQILNIGTNCPLDCSYCILQAYFNQPSLRVFVNLEEKLEQIGWFLEGQLGKIFRIGTGEFTDSLALDPILGWSDRLIPFFAGRRNAVLELKTKTDQIEHLFSSRHRSRIIVSWSLNSPYVASREEKGAPGMKKRLQAAKRCQSEGFTLGFHFDPLIQHPEWRTEYTKAIEMMDKYIDPKGIIWVSLGGLRYMPALKDIIRKRHRGTHILDGEFISGLDGKMRYFKPIRIDMYAFVREVLEKWHDNLGLYLCMESDEVWQKALGWSPHKNEGLSDYLDGRVVEFFGTG